MNEAMIFVSKRGLDLVHKWQTSVYLSVDSSSLLLSSSHSPHPFLFFLYFNVRVLKQNIVHTTDERATRKLMGKGGRGN